MTVPPLLVVISVARSRGPEEDRTAAAACADDRSAVVRNDRVCSGHYERARQNHPHNRGSPAEGENSHPAWRWRIWFGGPLGDSNVECLMRPAQGSQTQPRNDSSRLLRYDLILSPRARYLWSAPAAVF